MHNTPFLPEPVVAASAQTNPENKQFYKLTLESVISHFKAGLINATGLLFYWINVQRKQGWKLEIDVVAAISQLGIKQSTFYKAIGKLKAAGLIEVETRSRISVRVPITVQPQDPQDTPKQPDSTVVEPILRNENAFYDHRNDSTIVEKDSTIVETETPESLKNKASSDSPDIYQSFSNHIHIEEHVEKHVEKNENNQPGNTPETPAPLQPELLIEPITIDSKVDEQKYSQAKPVLPEAGQASNKSFYNYKTIKLISKDEISSELELSKSKDRCVQSQRRVNPSTGKESSCATDPWMVNDAEPLPIFQEWLYARRKAAQKNLDERNRQYMASPENAAAEIRNSWVRANDLWKVFLDEQSHRVEIFNQRLLNGISIADTEAEEIKNIVAYSSIPLAVVKSLPTSTAPQQESAFPEAPTQSVMPQDGENPQAYQLFDSSALPDASTPPEGFLEKLIGKMAMPPLQHQQHKPANKAEKLRTMLASGEPALIDEARKIIAKTPDFYPIYDEQGVVIDFECY